MRCALLGRTLSHSYSPQIHSLLGDYAYDLIELEPQELGSFLRCGDFTGLNVTIPYKKEVLPYCDSLTPVAQMLGAVNTIVRQSDGTLLGHNSDYFGFTSMVTRSGLFVAGKKVLVLGSGGASATVTAVLQQLGACVTVISRSGPDNYTNLHRHADAAVLVNATPVGMYPHGGTSPVDLAQFPQLEGVLDLIYNPARTKLLLDAQARGLITENGLWMLVAQAWESAQLFMGQALEPNVIERIHGILSRQMENIILIGMPGCGKSTVGRLLAEKTNRRFVDADTVLVEDAAMTIPEIFANEGEAGFRARETKILTQLGALSGAVIATGGGCVTQPVNAPLLRQNGRIVWLERTLDALPTDGRPLSQASSLEAMYEARRPLYAQFADVSVSNSSTPENAAKAILEALEAL